MYLLVRVVALQLLLLLLLCSGFETATVVAAAFTSDRIIPTPTTPWHRHGMISSPITSNCFNIHYSRYHHKTQSWTTTLAIKDKEDDLDEDSPKPGMEEAFRALNALQSSDIIGTTEDKSNASPKIQANATDWKVLQTVSEIPPEKELESYKSLVQELETNEEAEHYADMLAELGSSAQVDDTYSQVIMDLGGTPKNVPNKETENHDDNLAAITKTTTTAQPSTEEFMEAALQEAMREVRVNNPKLNRSVLDDAELMQEIEKIFDSGNEKLLESLAKIRREQEALARESAQASADRAEQRAKEDVQRLQMAESNLRRLLSTVDRERKNVEDAKRDMERVNAQLENDLLYKLKTGGIVKQSAFVGLLLFSVRSILDSISALQGDESALGTALVQGAIALACAILFNVL